MRVETLDSFKALPDEAVLLFDDNERTSFFHGSTWFDNFSSTQVVGQDKSRYYLIFNNSNQLAAVFCMYANIEPHGFLGNAKKLSGMSNYYASLFMPHFSQTSFESDEVLRDTIDSFSRHIKQEKPAWDSIELKPLDLDSRVFNMLCESLGRSGFHTQKYFCFGNWFMDVKGFSFQDYFSGLSSRVRNTVNRKEKKLLKNREVDLKIVTLPEGIVPVLEGYEIIYRSSWKKDEPSEKFIRHMVQGYSEKGYLRFGIIYVDGEPAAAQIWIVCHNIASIYKLAYDEKFSKLSVGSVLTKALMRHVLDVDKVHEIDYLTGDDPYKKDWMTSRRERWGIVAYNKATIRGNILALRHVLPSFLKRKIQGLVN